MCGPTLAWDWLVLDVSYVLVLVGGAIVLRARVARPITWVSFGTLAVCVGGMLFGLTFTTQASAASSDLDAVAMLASC